MSDCPLKPENRSGRRRGFLGRLGVRRCTPGSGVDSHDFGARPRLLGVSRQFHRSMQKKIGIRNTHVAPALRRVRRANGAVAVTKSFGACHVATAIWCPPRSACHVMRHTCVPHAALAWRASAALLAVRRLSRAAPTGELARFTGQSGFRILRVGCLCHRSAETTPGIGAHGWRVYQSTK